MFKDWKDNAILMAEHGDLSWRKIAKVLGVSKSTVSDFLRKYYSEKYKKPDLGMNVPNKGSSSFPKILFIDIETAPILAQMWSMWQQGFGLNQIQQDWFILSFCAKWAHSDEIIYHDQRYAKEIEDDYDLLVKIWDLLNEADFVVGQNSKKFDVKKINARLIINGLPKPSTFRQIDTLEIAKQQFGFTSNKLEYMTDKLCSRTKKSKHEKFPGHTLWSECLKGNLEAWEEMEHYNKDDVISLEELYNILSSWDNKLPNFDVYVDEILDMSEWEKDGFHYTNFGKYQRYRNKKTGQQKRSRVNLLTKEKRASLLANIT